MTAGHSLALAPRAVDRGRPRLLEREGVLGTAERLLERARAGAGGTVVVVGEGGMGKTAVLNEVRAMADGRGMRVAAAHGDRLETVLPLGLISQLIECMALAPASLDSADVHWISRSAAANSYAALRWLRDAAAQPVVILIDDLHWSDADSLLLLGFLCRRIGSMPVAVVATLRRWPAVAEEVCLHLVERGHAQYERLRPLTDAGAGALARQLASEAGPLAGTRRAGRSPSWWRCCAGNPLLIEALAANPRALDKRIVQRLARLPAGPSRLTEAGLILGDPFTYGDAAALAGLDEAEARSALDTACRVGILQLLPDGGMSFVHESVREAYAMALPPPVAFRLRQRAAALRPSAAISGHGSHGAANAVASRENLARGWAELTSREQAVARLAGTGASNRDLASQLFLSVNTIETHLKSVYAKLGIRSRRQLMTMSDG